MFCILVSNLVFRGTIPFDKTRKMTVGFRLHGRDEGEDGNPRGTGWSGQAWHTSTRPDLRGVAGQNRTGLGDLSVEGSGAWDFAVEETVQKHRHARRHRTGSRRSLRGDPTRCTLPCHSAAAPGRGSCAMIGIPAGQARRLRLLQSPWPSPVCEKGMNVIVTHPSRTKDRSLHRTTAHDESPPRRQPKSSWTARRTSRS